MSSMWYKHENDFDELKLRGTYRVKENLILNKNSAQLHQHYLT